GELPKLIARYDDLRTVGVFAVTNRNNTYIEGKLDACVTLFAAAGSLAPGCVGQAHRSSSTFLINDRVSLTFKASDCKMTKVSFAIAISSGFVVVSPPQALIAYATCL